MNIKNTRITGYILFLATTLAGFSIVLAAGGGGGGGGGSSGGGGGAGGGGSAAATTGAAVNTGAGLGTQDQLRTQDQIRDPSTHTGTEPDQLQTRDRDRIQQSTTSSVIMGATTSTISTTSPGGQERFREQEQVRINLQLPSTTAQNGSQLHQMIQEREREMEQAATSTGSTSTAAAQNVIQNQNQIRLAAYALIAAQNLLGNNGSQIAAIAGQIDDSSGAIANAEQAINARGALSHFFFGGDAVHAAAIQQEVAQNQARITQITQLLNQASSTTDVKATLQAQIQTMTNEQNRLQELAVQEQKQWGLFSWRLF